MDIQSEKILIEGAIDYRVLKVFKILGIIFFIFSIVEMTVAFVLELNNIIKNPTIDITTNFYLYIIVGCIFGFLSVIFFANLNLLKSFKLTVTNKRVFGTGYVKKENRRRKEEFSLPINQISFFSKADSFLFIFKYAEFSTSSGTIKFGPCKNIDEINKIMVDLLESKIDISENKKIPISNAEELRKFNDLLKDGVINQEEFDEKKKEILRRK